jgi:hypothetical protein
MASNSNRGVVYLKPGVVEVQRINLPSFHNPAGKEIHYGVILKVVSTSICGSDQHMVRGRTTAPAGMVLGHTRCDAAGVRSPKMSRRSRTAARRAIASVSIRLTTLGSA